MKPLENSLTTSFSRHAPRSVSVQLPQIDDEPDISVAPEAIRETKRERANKWRDKASRGRRNQMFTVNDSSTYAPSGDKERNSAFTCGKKLGIKWLGPYKIIEVIRNGGAHVLENTF